MQSEEIAKRYAQLMSRELEDPVQFLTEGEAKALKDIPLGYDIKAYNGETISDEPTFFAVDTEEPKELEETVVGGYGDKVVSDVEIDKVHQDNATYDRDDEDDDNETELPSDDAQISGKEQLRKRNRSRSGLKTSRRSLMNNNRHLKIRKQIQERLAQFGI